ncbi:MAG: phospho-N-acetylmuramoyl-pentapeptide-transferase [Elusimicrobiota bacterium]
MIYMILYPLRDVVSVFNLFKYITFRSAYAALTSVLLSFLLGPVIIRLLQKKQIGEIVRLDGPQSHLSKGGTPTMGGFIILCCVIVPTLLWADLNSFYIWVILCATTWMGIIGFIDDYLKVVKKSRKGLIARYKMIGQFVLGAALAFAILKAPSLASCARTSTMIPFFKNVLFEYSVPIFFVVSILVIMGSSNAVNLTDGLDGLAIGLLGIAFSAFGIFAYVSGHATFSNYLRIPYLVGSGELTVFCASTIGACLGFLWFNTNPAKIFMGDVGSLSMGSALGALALLIKKELLLLIIGGVFVMEALSVIIQVGSYKIRKKRVFKMAPVHHHFELKGWKESQVVVRFWILGIMFAVVGLSFLKIR